MHVYVLDNTRACSVHISTMHACVCAGQHQGMLSTHINHACMCMCWTTPGHAQNTYQPCMHVYVLNNTRACSVHISTMHACACAGQHQGMLSTHINHACMCMCWTTPGHAQYTYQPCMHVHVLDNTRACSVHISTMHACAFAGQHQGMLSTHINHACMCMCWTTPGHAQYTYQPCMHVYVLDNTRACSVHCSIITRFFQEEEGVSATKTTTDNVNCSHELSLPGLDCCFWKKLFH